MKEPKDYIIFPLDVPTHDQAMHYVSLLKDQVGLFKVGLELFISQGPSILKAIRKRSRAGIFLDLKLHDIPITVKRAFLSASELQPQFVSVHCDEGADTLKGVAENNPGGTKILAITVLTSLDTEKLKALGYPEEYAEDISKLVLLKARMAREAGCHGVVCSGHELPMLKTEFGSEMIFVTPGIRPAWSLIGQDDQKRIVTPAVAVAQGADHIVVGRPIRDAKDPVEASEKVAEEIKEGLQSKS